MRWMAEGGEFASLAPISWRKSLKGDAAAGWDGPPILGMIMDAWKPIWPFTSAGSNLFVKSKAWQNMLAGLDDDAAFAWASLSVGRGSVTPAQ